MLTISKPLSAGQEQTYHEVEFTAKGQNYWSQRAVITGEWQGRLAGHFGLAGTVSAEDFTRLSQGQHRHTGEHLVRQRASYEYQDADGKTVKTMEHRAGWDATFSAPKSVSPTAPVRGDERVREPHRESVRVALNQLEGCFGPQSVFLAEDVFFSVFSPLNPRLLKAGVIPAVLPVKGLR